MGIQNLLRFLKPFIEPVHIKKYGGKRVGIDAYSWLHKGAYSCSMELCLQSRTEAATRYLKYFLHHINLLRHYKVTPIVVFDGGNIPCKAVTEHERRKRRKDNLAMAKQKLEDGDVTAAIELFQKAVSITPSMAHELIQILRSENVEFIVAPYEADAQLAHLSTLDDDCGGISAVITEDSDLVAYGCQAIIFKMDRHGNGEELLLDRVFKAASPGLSFTHFDNELFTGMCVLAGCDFLSSIPGIGIKRAYALMSKYRSLDRVLSVLKFDKHYKMPEDYSKSFFKAVSVFHHARIYDTKLKSLKHLKPLEEKHLQYLDGDLDFVGPDLPSSLAAAIAEGDMNPITMEAFDRLPKSRSCSDMYTASSSQSDKSSDLSLTESFETYEDCNRNFIAATVDRKKYMKEAIAIGKLIAQREDSSEEELEIRRIVTPNNNPFKRQKIDTAKGTKKDIEVRLPSASLEIEEIMEIPNSFLRPTENSECETIDVSGASATSKGVSKINKEIKRVQSERFGILRFFQKL